MTRKAETLLLVVGLALGSAILGVQLDTRRNPSSEVPFEEVLANHQAGEASADGASYVVFISPRCDRCAELWLAIIRLQQMWGGAGVPGLKVLVVSHEQDQTSVAMAFECAAVEGKKWDFANAFLRTGGEGEISDLAREAGVVNLQDHSDCVTRERYRYLLDSRLEEMHSVGETTAPLVVSHNGNEVGVVPIGQFVTILDSLLSLPPNQVWGSMDRTAKEYWR